jgi:hypothetical protein
VLVRDHGKGMSEDRLAEIQSKGSGVGIGGMRERQLQGELTVESKRPRYNDFGYLSCQGAYPEWGEGNSTT